MRMLVKVRLTEGTPAQLREGLRAVTRSKEEGLEGLDCATVLQSIESPEQAIVDATWYNPEIASQGEAQFISALTNESGVKLEVVGPVERMLRIGEGHVDPIVR